VQLLTGRLLLVVLGLVGVVGRQNQVAAVAVAVVVVVG